MATTIGHLTIGMVKPYFDELDQARASFDTAVSFARRLALSAEMTKAYRQHPLPLALGYDARYPGWPATPIARGSPTPRRADRA